MLIQTPKDFGIGRGQIFVGGSWADSASADRREIFNPKDETAVDAVAAEIIAGRPPTMAVTTAIEKEAYSPTLGSTPATIEKPIASGISARATSTPDSSSVGMFVSHSRRNVWKNLIFWNQI